MTFDRFSIVDSLAIFFESTFYDNTPRYVYRRACEKPRCGSSADKLSYHSQAMSGEPAVVAPDWQSREMLTLGLRLYGTIKLLCLPPPPWRRRKTGLPGINLRSSFCGNLAKWLCGCAEFKAGDLDEAGTALLRRIDNVRQFECIIVRVRVRSSKIGKMGK